MKFIEFYNGFNKDIGFINCAILYYRIKIVAYRLRLTQKEMFGVFIALQVMMNKKK